MSSQNQFRDDFDDVNASLQEASADDRSGRPADDGFTEFDPAAYQAQLLAKLNDRQREAVSMARESGLVLAGAGSGKTSVLTARIAYLVADGVAPNQIMAVTFTNKAALEMRKRLGKILASEDVNDIWVGTFHSLCNRMLREQHIAAGLPKNFAILDNDGQELMIKGLMRDAGLLTTKAERTAAAQARAASVDPLAGLGGGAVEESDSGDDERSEIKPKDVVSWINKKKEFNVRPEAVEVRGEDERLMLQMYVAYQQSCADQGLLDFSDLLYRGVELLEKDAMVRQQYRSRFKALLVDEFQDTNDVQYRWLQQLKSADGYVMAVGDDDQSIYAFRGANPENMQRFVKEMTVTDEHPEGRVIKLEQNYRSLPYILDAANAVIDRNSGRIGKSLWSQQRDGGERIVATEYGSGYFEATRVAAKIHALIKDKRVAPSEIAVLYRTNTQSRILEQELNKLSVPLTVYGGFRFFERQEVKNVLAYMDLVCSFDRDISLSRIVNFPPRGLGERTVEELRQEAKDLSVSMMEMIGRRTEEGLVTGGAAQRKQAQLETFASLILDLTDVAQTQPLSSLVEAIVENAGIRAHYRDGKESKEECEERLANIDELIAAARQFEADNPHLATAADQLPEYLSFVQLMTSTSEADMGRKNTVSLMTVHASKGLEFDHVFITGLEEGIFPHARSIQEAAEHGNGRSISQAEARYADRLAAGDDIDYEDHAGDDDDDTALPEGPAIEEERRLAYVALTRARKSLEVSYAKTRLVGREERATVKSRFLGEIPAQRLMPVRDGAPTQRQHHQASGAPRPAPAAGAARQVAVIGTAGRDRQRSMDASLWRRMVADLKGRVSPKDVLVSGGAAWADHLAVTLFLGGHVAGLKLHLPAPLVDGRFAGPERESAGSAANYYHGLFRQATGVDGLADIAEAIKRGAKVTYEPEASGYSAMYARNRKVAGAADLMLAYTFGDGADPADGGTKHTWDLAHGATRLHVPLGSLGGPAAAPAHAADSGAAPRPASPRTQARGPSGPRPPAGAVPSATSGSRRPLFR